MVFTYHISLTHQKPVDKIPSSYRSYLSGEGYVFYYFFEDLITKESLHDSDDLDNGIISLKKESVKEIPDFETYYTKTSVHYSDFSDAFKSVCRKKYYYIYLLLRYLANCDGGWEIVYRT